MSVRGCKTSTSHMIVRQTLIRHRALRNGVGEPPYQRHFFDFFFFFFRLLCKCVDSSSAVSSAGRFLPGEGMWSSGSFGFD